MISFFGTVLGDIGFDAVISEDTDLESQVTQHPVEFGADVTDHIFMKPVQLTIQGGVTDAVVRMSPEDDPFGASFSSEGTRSQNAYGALETIQKAGEPFTVVTNLKTFENVVLKGLRVIQDRASSKVLLFSASLQELILVQSELDVLPASRLASPEDASPEKRGVETPVNRSILETLFGVSR